ncbi:MAG: hypothetical protein IPP87_24615 [Ideonella sp.]|nr:hypothetical protein [Ideonella sp.]
MNTTATPVSPLAAPAAVARQALQLAQRVLDLAKAFAKPHDMCQANTQVARCLKALHELSSAESHLDKALGWSALIPCVDVRVDLLCELSELAVSRAEAAPATMIRPARAPSSAPAPMPSRPLNWQARPPMPTGR